MISGLITHNTHWGDTTSNVNTQELADRSQLSASLIEGNCLSAAATREQHGPDCGRPALFEELVGDTIATVALFL